MADGTLVLAYNMYKKACENHSFLRGADIDSFMELLNCFIASRVRMRIPASDDDFDDLLNECLLKVWNAAELGVFPADRVERFVGGINTICRNMCIDFLRSRGARDRLSARLQDVLAPEPPPMTPEDICCTREIAESPVELIVAGMQARSRFPAINEDTWRAIAQKLFADRPLSELRSVIKGARLYRFDFMLKYVVVVYQWTFSDLRGEVLHILDKVRPTR